MVDAGGPERIATCACGQLRAACKGAPLAVSLCHCLECQKRTGSTYGIAAFFNDDAVTVEGASSIFERPSDSGYHVSHHFCPACGGTVFWYPARKPGLVAVAVGAFADPHFPGPTQTVYRQHRHDWVTIASEAEKP